MRLLSGRLELLFGSGTPGLDEAPLGFDVGDLGPQSDEATVAVLEDEELLYGFEHGGWDGPATLSADVRPSQWCGFDGRSLAAGFAMAGRWC
ncbi:MAG: hypothetical protein L6Q38_16700 [Nitrospira sp.]|nr:hypothetical protein [Nitrospira sp.]